MELTQVNNSPEVTFLIIRAGVSILNIEFNHDLGSFDLRLTLIVAVDL